MSKPRKSKINLQTAKDAAARHPVLVALLTIVSFAIGACVWFFMPLPKNTAMVVFQLSGNESRIMPGAGEAAVDLRSFGPQQAAMLKRRQVLSNALNKPEMANLSMLESVPDKIAWFDKNLIVDFKSGPGLMRVILEGDQAEEILTIIKSVSEAYMAETDIKEHGARKLRLNRIEEAIARQQDSVSQKTNEIDRIAKLLKTTDGPTLAIIDQLNQDELRTARKAMIDLEYKIENLRVDLSGPPAEAGKDSQSALKEVIDEEIRKDPAMSAAETRVSSARLQLRELESRFSPGTKNQLITKATQELSAAEDAREKLRAELRTREEALVKTRQKAELLSQQSKIKQNLDQLTRQKSILESQIDEILAKINKHGTYRFDLDKNRKEIASTEKLLTSLTEERDKLRVEDKTPSRVSVAEEPFVQSGIEGYRRIRTTLLASLGFFGLGFGLLVWREQSGRRVSESEDLSGELGLTVLGSIPKNQSMASDFNRTLIESIDSMRTHFLQAGRSESPMRTIMVASGLSGEGKTTLSGHLAVSLARAGYRVLLVDGDMHSPTACGIFDLPPIPGISELLRGESSPAEAIHPTKINGLFVMPAGSWDMLTRQRLVGDAWSALRVELESLYDFLIIDSSPILLTADTLLLAKHVDAVLISALAGSSRIESIDLALEKLASLRVRVLGAVLNGSSHDFNQEYYGRRKTTRNRVAVSLKGGPDPRCSV